MRNLFILRGAPASGKSTWITENNLEPYTLSTDSLRLMYQSPITTPEGELAISQNHDKEVWGLLLDLLEKRMENGELVVIDATHYKSSLLNRYKDLVNKYRYRVYVVDFSNVSEEELKRRNANRGFRKVPDDVIEKMCVALKDDSEVKKSYTIVTSKEAIQLINSPLEPFNADDYEKVVIFGDIHGCYDPLKEYFDKNPFNEKYNYIFCGDYLDRGLQNKEVLEFLISLKDKKNCVFLEGNHEKWLRIYSQKDYDMEYYENRPVEYKDPFVTKLLAQLKERQITLEKKINKNKNTSEELSKLLRESWEIDPENREVFYRFEKVNVPEKQSELHREIGKMENQLKVLTRYIHDLQHEEYSSQLFIEKCREWFKEEFSTDLSMDITNIIEKKYNVTSNRKDNPIKSLEFIKRTYPQIKDINKTEIRRFCDRLAQMSYFAFNGHSYLVTHGGVPCMPTMKTQTIEMIKGVGKYEDHDKIDKQFVKNTEGYVYQIHGHRNIMRIPLKHLDSCYYSNLEGQVEFGGCLRILEISKQNLVTVNVPVDMKMKDVKSLSNSVEKQLQDGNTFITTPNNVNLGVTHQNHYNFIEIKNNIHIPETMYIPNSLSIEIKEEKSDLEILNQMWDSKWVQVKELKDNVLSFNFTRDAFEKDKWNTLTCHARGLFVDSTNGNIVARSFSKFFNRNQVDETKSPALKQNFKYPVIGYRKENGFLGIVSKYNGKIYFFTKSSDSGDFVNWFIGALCDNYNIYALPETYSITRISHLTHYTDIYNRMVRCELEADKIPYQACLDVLKRQLIDKLKPLLINGYSYVFECIDPVNDPHIIKYDSSKVVLLEVFKNQLKEDHVFYDNLISIAQELNVTVKQKELEFNNWEEFEEWKNKFTTGITQWDCKHEGYVFEDANGFRVKCKSTFYSWWKQMRSIKEAIQNGRENRKIYKTKEEIQVVKLMEELGREKLKEMSIIDVEDLFYEKYEEENK